MAAIMISKEADVMLSSGTSDEAFPFEYMRKSTHVYMIDKLTSSHYYSRPTIIGSRCADVFQRKT